MEDENSRQKLRSEPKTDKILVNVKRIKWFSNAKEIVRYVDKGGYHYVVMAFCHSQTSKLKKEFLNRGLKYPYSLVSHQDWNCVSCKPKKRRENHIDFTCY